MACKWWGWTGDRNPSCYIKAGRWAKRAGGIIRASVLDQEDTAHIDVITEARAGAGISNGLPHIPRGQMGPADVSKRLRMRL